MDISSINPGGKSQFYSDRSQIGNDQMRGDGLEGAAVQAVGAADKQTTRLELEKSVESLNKFIQTNKTHLSFVLHEKLNEYYVQIVDDQTREVVREIPSKKMLDIVAEMKSMIGLLVDEKR